MLGAWAIDAGIRYFQLGFYLSKNQMAWLVVWATFIQACVPRLMNETLFANLTLLCIDALKAISYGMAVWLLFSFFTQSFIQNHACGVHSMYHLFI